MNARYALVKDGIVVDLVAWNGDGDLFNGFQTVGLTEDAPASVGWNYNGKHFSPPPEPEKTHEELVAEVDAEKQSRLDYAAGKIVIWQTRLLMGRKLATDETTSLNIWMDYIDALEAVDTSEASEINWPTLPDAQGM
ncbi:tail fiber assembly protein [Enterobacter roggenkampii]|uniref:tail fiber assembly protein n=1 Tax=Enterobacter roggenkampii TaxID=1812935 RepID=UPI002DBC5996|nr:tail fiber assembly protein [Enterobacter roggenkampii]MEB6511332.1 tail fiber assembly protein [Enterobacter roggenkampii]